MKRWKSLLCLYSVVCMTLLAACNSEAPNTSQIAEDDEPKISLDYGIIDPYPETIEDMVLEYKGSPIEVTVMLQNGDVAAEWGVLLYMNGVQQAYKFEDQDMVMKSTKLKPGERQDLRISFTPVGGKAGEEMTMHLMTVLNPSFRITSDEEVTYGNNHKLAQMLPYRIIMAEDSPVPLPEIMTEQQTQELPDELHEQYIQTDENNQTIDLLDNYVGFQLHQSGNDGAIFHVKNGETLNLAAQGFGKTTKYRVSLYLDHELVPIREGIMYNDMQIETGKLSTFSSSIDMSAYSPGSHFVYLIAVPITETYTLDIMDAIKTDSAILWIE